MPWREKNRMKLREEFVLRALEPDANMAALCHGAVDGGDWTSSYAPHSSTSGHLRSGTVGSGF